MTTHESDDRLTMENAQLRARVEELERMLGATARPSAPSEPVGRVPYEAFFNALPMPISIYDQDGWLVALNDISCAIFGTTREIILGKYNIVHDQEAIAKGYTDGFLRALAGEVAVLPPTSYDIPAGPLHAEPGRRLWTESTFFPFRDASGAPLIVASTFDVTSRRQAEAMQRKSAALLHALIENAPFLIYTRDTEGRHTIVNHECAAFFGEDRDAIVGKTAHELIPAEVADVWRAQDIETMGSDGPIITEDRIDLPDGQRVFMTTKFTLRDEDEGIMGVCGMSLDITERVRAEEKSRRLQDEMLRARDEMLRSISTPLLPIADGVLVVPVVGEVTHERAEQLIQTLLQGVSTQKARIAVLDVTGMQHAGTEVTDALVRAARSVRLLGAEIILTGIRPSVAQSLVQIGADLGDIVTRGTLERGVAFALSMIRGGAAR